MTDQSSSQYPAEHVSNSDTPDRSIIVDSWHVPDGSQDEFMAALVDVFERLRMFDGFLDGQILRGVDRSRFVSYAYDGIGTGARRRHDRPGVAGSGAAHRRHRPSQTTRVYGRAHLHARRIRAARRLTRRRGRGVAGAGEQLGAAGGLPVVAPPGATLGLDQEPLQAVAPRP